MSKVIKNGTVCTADRAWKADVLIEGESDPPDWRKPDWRRIYRC